MSVETKGFGELLEELNRMRRTNESRAVATRALRAGAQIILDDMKRRASTDPRRRTGDLMEALDVSGVSVHGKKKYITVGAHRKDWEKRAHKPEDGENVYYPAYVEYGHGGPGPAPAHPYMRIAFDSEKQKAYEAMRRVLTEELRKKG